METRLGHISWGAAARPRHAGGPLGDAWLVLPRSDGILIAVIDALGHGAEAAECATRACSLLSREPDAPLVRMMEHCHEGLRGTRGAAVVAAVIHESSGVMNWLGVGNVQGWLQRAETDPRAGGEPLLLRNGIVGRLLPPLAVERTRLSSRGALILATDGIDPRVVEGFSRSDSSKRDAERLLERHFLGGDDGLVLVVGLDRDSG